MRTIILLLFLSSALQAQPPVGSWTGAIDIQGFKLRLVFNLEETDGVLSATLDSPDQQAFGIPVKEAVYEAPKLTLKMPDIGASFNGKLNAAGDELAGVFEQGGMKMDLVLKPKEGELAPIRRPQDPEPPYPYLEEEVRFLNPNGGHHLAGTLTLPPGEGPHPAVVMITGSGPQDRNEDIMNHRPFWVIADYLSRRGFAVLRFDDRGFKESEGDFASATTADFATDVAAACAFLRTRSDIRSSDIGLIGHSEGGLIAPIVAVEHTEVAFMVLLAAPGLPGEEVILAQQQLILKASGISEKGLAFNQTIMEGLLERVKKQQPAEKRQKKMQAFVKKEFKGVDPAILEELQISLDNMPAMIATLDSDWFRYFIQFDPRPTLEQVQCPVLALNGKLDLQVPWSDNLEAIEAALGKGGNSNIETHALPGLNHLFQTSLSGSGSPQEYGVLDETIAPAVLELMAAWMKKQVVW